MLINRIFHNYLLVHMYVSRNTLSHGKQTTSELNTYKKTKSELNDKIIKLATILKNVSKKGRGKNKNNIQ